MIYSIASACSTVHIRASTLCAKQAVAKQRKQQVHRLRLSSFVALDSPSSIFEAQDPSVVTAQVIFRGMRQQLDQTCTSLRSLRQDPQDPPENHTLFVVCPICQEACMDDCIWLQHYHTIVECIIQVLCQATTLGCLGIRALQGPLG